MQLLHTEEQIAYYDNLNELVEELRDLWRKYNKSELIDLATQYELEVAYELSKYKSYIGKECKAPPIYRSNIYRPGKITGNFYFNKITKSVMCYFDYNTGGYDAHAIINLIE
jgi:hypothetical protein